MIETFIAVCVWIVVLWALGWLPLWLFCFFVVAPIDKYQAWRKRAEGGGGLSASLRPPSPAHTRAAGRGRFLLGRLGISTPATRKDSDA